MLAQFATFWDRLRTSLWALPIAIVAVGAALAVATLQLRIGTGDSPVWWLYSGDTSSASAFLANLLTAMITMATLAISITMVVLTLAAQSLGPRLIPIFMGDRQTKVALGPFIGTVVYLLIILRSLAGTGDSLPNLAVTVGTLLFLASVIVLVFFLNRLARSIVADTIIERVGRALDASALKLLGPKDSTDPGDTATSELASTGTPFTLEEGGYIQFIDHQAAVAAARRAKAVAVLRFRPGHFMLAGDVAGWIVQAEGEQDLRRSIGEAIIRGSERTPLQNIEYSVRQLVDIALRALSPGVNDPHTACSVIDRMAASLALMMKHDMPQSVWRDADDVIRLVVPTTTFEGVVDAGFSEIRQAGEGIPAVLIRLVDRLGQLLDHADESQTEVLERHLDHIEATARRTIADESGRAAFAERVAAARARERISVGDWAAPAMSRGETPADSGPEA